MTLDVSLDAGFRRGVVVKSGATIGPGIVIDGPVYIVSGETARSDTHI
jgi:bifunctional UDP-N-acetylglucosamine pyrophosphorylase/glucosamine-1-phosphate N-acetyltransferase